ncbi:peptidyl-prolyl cis-trans isomerase [Bartonella krasnovii]|uniref:Parvulin-like PPIase n=1 Tax=Bartonella krasnovii TaxID=2267275 RepID=A0ABY3VW55_9HYPH|nr:peptidyl-prolyl cis-trans isomerase [Bartonella krasnovii]UNF29623.1 peptidyl-prolyl cis-trans isomerase [Bartonella krasnovii]UNF35982.1 peptidyl-prolyl cis-trans isomerase [Bartonella krasnovii]UNF37594.1 peptidyl-prolyl cis-trans isomerase [Bartonella krasnovii]UNF45918.1 peptidyl-prolyl cis-trans isomerase [Bartonella krasnovii]UNF49169.1 peptidyl-prolyl cis-trans isomerase [Bartonella krasnovii]
MLDVIRSATNSWISRVFLAILLLCFILLWGIPQLHTRSERDLITSGKSIITIDDYRLALADQSARLAQAAHLGRMFTPNEMQQYQIPAFVFNQLQQNVLLDEQVRKMKINLSKDTIAHTISSDKMFQVNGTFDKDLFYNYLQHLRISESAFLNYYTKQEKRNQLIAALLSDIKAPNLFYKALALYQGEMRSADYLVIDLKEKQTIADPDHETLQKWFETHQSEFRTPEYRTVSLLSMQLNDFIKPNDISIDEAKAYYTQNESHFVTPEKRIFEELRFPTREEADKAAKKIADGLSFDELVKAEKKTLNDIKKGPLAENELPNHLASEIFELPQGQISPVINDLQGPILVRVTHIEPASALPFESVEENIRQTLAKNRAANEIRNNYVAIENARFEGASFKELADQYKLTLRTITLDKTGKTLEGTILTDLPQKDTLLNAIYQSNEGVDLDPLSFQNGGYLWYKVDKIIPARDKTLEEAKIDVLSQWKNEEIQRLLDEKAQSALKQLMEGKSLVALAQTLGVTKQTTPLLRRQDPSEILGVEGIKTLFSGPKGHYGIIKGPVVTNRIVYQIKSVTMPKDITPHTLPSEVRANIDMMIREDLKLEMLQIANKEHPLEINSKNYNQIFNALQ